MCRVLANGPGDRGSSRVIPKTKKKWYLIPLCLTLSIIWCVSIVKWSNSGKGVVPSPRPRCRSYWKRSLVKWSLTGLKAEFTFFYTSCHTKFKEPSLPYYLPKAAERIIRFIPFLRVLALYKMQSVSSRIWIHVAVSISYNGNCYTTNTSYVYIVIHSQTIKTLQWG